MPDTSTEVALATTTLSSAAANITFSSISGTYTDLRLILVGTTSANRDIYLRFNSDSTALYSNTYIFGDGFSALTSRTSGATQIILQNSWVQTQPLFLDINIFSYSGSTNKTALIAFSNDGNGAGETNRNVGLYRSTSAITSITILPSTGNWNTGTTATLYGIL